jgi:hypothetical protein
MKYIIFILLMFSCHKEQTCWKCTTMEGPKVYKEWTTCDVLESTEWDGKRVVKTVTDYSGTTPVSTVKVYTTTCK